MALGDLHFYAVEKRSQQEHFVIPCLLVTTFQQMGENPVVFLPERIKNSIQDMQFQAVKI